MIDLDRVCADVAASGFAVAANGFTDAEVESLTAEVDVAAGDVAGLRNLFKRFPAVRVLPRHPAVRSIVEALLGPGAFAVRAILFDKTPGANWNVAWHQDVTIAVAHRIQAPGFVAWSEKEGVPHVQPPVTVLERMLAIRVHLDDCGRQNGPLGVLPGSHTQGRLDRAASEDWQRRTNPVTCCVPRGGLLVMRPLLLHSSSAAESVGRRRVIHLEFAAAALEPPLTWREQWPIDKPSPI